MTTPPTPTPSATPSAAPAPTGADDTGAGRVPLRVRLDPGPRTGSIDGAWWPQSTDLQTEAADLVDHVDPDVGRVARLLYSRPDWSTPEDGANLRRIHAARGPVKAGSFPGDDTHTMVAVLLSGRRLRLVVVPSETPAEAAEDILARASRPGNEETARGLLGLAHPDQVSSRFHPA